MEEGKEVSGKIASYKLTEEMKKKLDIVYNEKDKEYYSFLLQQIEDARIQRDRNHKEFDDLSYIQDYEMNYEAMNTYLQKKSNPQEVRVNTPTTEKKLEVIHNELNALNFQPTVEAFDENDEEMIDVGRAFTSIVKRSNQIEKDDDFWNEAIPELIGQRALFFIEKFNEKTYYTRGANGKLRIKKLGFSQKRVLDGRQVYLGDIHIPAIYFDEQPFILVHEKLTYREATQIYGENKRFKDHVKPGKCEIGSLHDYRFDQESLLENEVDIVHYFSFPDGEYNCIIQGVMLYEAGNPLPYNYVGYPVKMVVLKSMRRNFAYGKPLTASVKTLQALDNETIRLFIRKFRQSIDPPLGVKRGKILAKDIFEAGKRTQGLSRNDFEKLIDHQGISSSDTAMMEIIEKKMEEFIGASNIMQGLQEKGGTTATEIIRLQRQALKQLGLAVGALIRAKREATLLRIYTEIENNSEPIRKLHDEMNNKIVNIYKRYNLKDTDLGDGDYGKHIVQFTDRDFSEQEKKELYQIERTEARKGKPVKFDFINKDKLKKIPIFWYVFVSSEERKSSELKQAMFTDRLNQIAGISKVTGRAIKGETVIKDFEKTWGVKDYFQKEEQLGRIEGGQVQNRNMQDERMMKLEELKKGLNSNQMMQGEVPTEQKPSINTMENQ